MSFSNRPPLSPADKLGCLTYGVVGAVIVIVCLLGAAMGDCAEGPHGTGCENDGLFRFLLFPGSLIIVAIGGVLLARFMMRDRN